MAGFTAAMCTMTVLVCCETLEELLDDPEIANKAIQPIANAPPLPQTESITVLKELEGLDNTPPYGVLDGDLALEGSGAPNLALVMFDRLGLEENSIESEADGC